jgi:hypothetical protein
MGGSNSGRWHNYTKKITVEECQSITIKELVNHKFLQPSVFREGQCTWSFFGYIPLVDFFVNTLDMTCPWVVLSYTLINPVLLTQKPVLYQVNLSVTEKSLTGLRWWFLCPLLVDNSPCHRRVTKLYLPPWKQHFGCRQCHQLTYRSSQLSHTRYEKSKRRFDVGCLNRPSAVDRFLDFSCPSRFSHVRWSNIFNDTRGLLGHQMRPMLIFTTR